MTVRRLLPDVADLDLDDLYADLAAEVDAAFGAGLDADLASPAGGARPYLAVGMVASVDGAATVDGHTGALGGAADQVAFRRLREVCDVVLVGAATVRVEDYGPPRPRPGSVERRRARGLADRPRVAVVTGSGRLDPDSRLFADPDHVPLVVTTATADVGHLDGRAEVVRCGEGRVDLAAALAALGERGLLRVLCEGGPSLNAQLLAADLVDELFLTVTPVLLGGDALRVVEGVPAPRRDLELVSLHHHAGELVLRYRIVRPHGRTR